LIFPWADGGNLGDYWKEYQVKSSELDSLQWIIGQFVGISAALEELHEHNTRHGDLKPENILWFTDKNDKGVLQIADLGLAAFHEEDEHTDLRRLGGKHTFTPSGTSRYEPPEMDRDRGKEDARSRQYDIWSMGCIVLELLIWVIYGYDAVKNLRSSTMYFWTKAPGEGYDIHPDVITRMEIMEGQLQDNTAYKELLHLVRNKLLIVKISEKYVSLPGCREIATELHTSFKDIHQKCQLIPSYLTPLRLEYSSPGISVKIPKPGVVYENEVGLATPARADAPRERQPSLPQISEPEDFGGQVLLRRPTEQINSDSLSSQASRIPKNQEVRELDRFGSLNVRS
jgi:serine/threonine protein kinase